MAVRRLLELFNVLLASTLAALSVRDVRELQRKDDAAPPEPAVEAAA